MHFRKAGNLIPKKLQNQKQRTRALVGGDRQEHSGALRTGKDQKFQGSWQCGNEVELRTICRMIPISRTGRREITCLEVLFTMLWFGSLIRSTCRIGTACLYFSRTQRHQPLGHHAFLL